MFDFHSSALAVKNFTEKFTFTNAMFFALNYSVSKSRTSHQKPLHHSWMKPCFSSKIRIWKTWKLFIGILSKCQNIMFVLFCPFNFFVSFPYHVGGINFGKIFHIIQFSIWTDQFELEKFQKSKEYCNVKWRNDSILQFYGMFANRKTTILGKLEVPC